MDTTPATLPAGPADEISPAPPRRARRRRWPWVVGALSLVLAGLLAAAVLVPLPYYAIGPGGARATEPIVTVRGGPSFDAGEEILFTTVSIDRATALEVLAAWLDPDIGVLTEEEVVGDQTPQENQELNEVLMDVSQSTAVLVAFEHLGYDVASGVVVAGVLDGLPADGVVEPGDTIVRVGDRRVDRVEHLVRAIDRRRPGHELVLVIEAPTGERRRETVRLGELEEAPGEPFLGVTGIVTRLDTPFEVRIDSGSVRGPSAGLAFVLAILDVLTPGDISGGVPVAVTGTIDERGRIGLVGGVEYKALSARAAGAEAFLVPAGEEDLARELTDDVEIVPVETLQDALEALEALGGDAVDLEDPEGAPARAGS